MHRYSGREALADVLEFNGLQISHHSILKQLPYLNLTIQQVNNAHHLIENTQGQIEKIMSTI